MVQFSKTVRRPFFARYNRPSETVIRDGTVTPMAYFLLGYVKSFVYAGKPQTLDHLEVNIRRVIYGPSCSIK